MADCVAMRVVSDTYGAPALSVFQTVRYLKTLMFDISRKTLFVSSGRDTKSRLFGLPGVCMAGDVNMSDTWGKKVT